MNETIVDTIVTGVELSIAALILVAMVFIGTMSQHISSSIAEQQAITADLKEYRIHNQYDFTHVYPQDVIAAIYRGRGEPTVEVISNKGNYTWSVTYAPCEYNTAAIASKIDQTVVYDASLKYDSNNVIIGYVFEAHKSGCGR